MPLATEQQASDASTSTVIKVDVAILPYINDENGAY